MITIDEKRIMAKLSLDNEVFASLNARLIEVISEIHEKCVPSCKRAQATRIVRRGRKQQEIDLAVILEKYDGQL
jgi:hypothetical protein